jgi:hypothetical protein
MALSTVFIDKSYKYYEIEVIYYEEGSMIDVLVRREGLWGAGE